MERFEFTLDGIKVPAEVGDTILQAAVRAGLEERIPTLCYEPGLPPYTSCFVCVVELEGRERLLPACSTPAAPGMVLYSESEKVTASRRTALELMLSDHPADCVAPCRRGCPAGVDVQAYLALAKDGLYLEAARIIRERNPFPGVCGRVCVRKCEDVCRRELLDDQPVGINMVKRTVADWWAEHPYDEAPGAPTGKRVGIVGGGPAGLTAAYYLRFLGHAVTVYEGREKLGGMLRYGIPDYRLPQEILDLEIQRILDLGVELRMGVQVGRDVELSVLRPQVDALFLTVGAQKGSPARIEGEDHPMVLSGVDFLGAVTRGEEQPIVGRKVAVVGGGNTAIDAARTALRLGAEHVTILYRRTRKEMPANVEEIEAAEHEGIRMELLIAPVEVLTDGDRLRGLTCRKMKLGEPDASGRRRPVPVEGSEHQVAFDVVIAAIGQSVDLAGLDDGLEVTRWGSIKADEWSCATSLDGVFAGGDALTGPSVVIDAIAHGRRAALSIDQYLKVGKPVRTLEAFSARKENFGEVRRKDLPPGEPGRRHRQHELPVAECINTFEEVELGLDDHEVEREAARCLSCGCAAAESCDLRRLAERYGLDDTVRGQTVKREVDSSHSRIVLDSNKCILCTRCVRTCGDMLGISILGLVNRGFETVLSPSLGRPLAGTDCIACGNCVDSCPTGALSFKAPAQHRPARIRTHSACTLCGDLCPVDLVENPYGLSVRPPLGEGDRQLLCALGRHGLPELAAGERLSTPLVRRDGRLAPATWDEAVERAIEGLTRVAAEHGVGSLLVSGGGELTCEEAARLAALGRSGLHAHTGSLALLAADAEPRALDSVTGVTRSSATYEDLETASCVLIVGDDPMESNPVAGARIRRAVRRGARVIALTSAPTRVTELADIRVEVRRGTASLALGWMLRKVLEERTDLQQDGGIRQALSGMTPERLRKDCGVGPSTVRDALDLLTSVEGSVVAVASLDARLERSPGSLPVLVELVEILSGGVPGSGVLLTSRVPNQQGLRLSGLLPRDDIEAEDLSVALQGRQLRGAWIVREDPDENRDMGAALSKLQFLVVQDCFMTATAARADVVLPASTHVETGGTFVRCDRRIMRTAPAAPRRVARSVSDVLELAGRRMGLETGAMEVAGREKLDNGATHLPRPQVVAWSSAVPEAGPVCSVHGELSSTARQIGRRLKSH